MPAPVRRTWPKWSTAESLAAVFSLALTLLVIGVWPFILERTFKAHLLRKARDKGALSKPHLDVFPATIDKDGFASSVYLNYTKESSGMFPDVSAVRPLMS